MLTTPIITVICRVSLPVLYFLYKCTVQSCCRQYSWSCLLGVVPFPPKIKIISDHPFLIICQNILHHGLLSSFHIIETSINSMSFTFRMPLCAATVLVATTPIVAPGTSNPLLMKVESDACGLSISDTTIRQFSFDGTIRMLTEPRPWCTDSMRPQCNLQRHKRSQPHGVC
jgi:hypothetical protein